MAFSFSDILDKVQDVGTLFNPTTGISRLFRKNVFDIADLADESLPNFFGTTGDDIAQADTSFDEAKTRKAIQDLIDRERELSGTFEAQETERRQERLRNLGSILAGQREQAFNRAAPGIMEDLSARGLLHSSALGEELAGEQSRLARQSELELMRQALQDTDVLAGIRGGALGREIELGRAGQERVFSLEDFEKQAALAREIAQIQASAQETAAQQNLLGNVLGAGATLGSAFLL